MEGALAFQGALREAARFLSSPGNVLSVAALVVALLCLLLYLRASYQLRRMRLFHERLWEEVDAPRLEEWVVRLDSRLAQVAERLEALDSSLRQLAEAQKGCLQKVGMVRYNAFPDVGGELSFSLALLDGRDDGVVLSGLYGREESRIYAKPIRNGTSPINLSDEEKEALRRATERREGRG